MAARFALYWAPREDTALARFGAGWLGRDAATGRALPQPAIAELAPERIAAITRAPRRYRFHATLKAPFRLAAGRSAAELHGAVSRFAAAQAAFEIGLLHLEPLAGFLALTPQLPSPRLQAFAAACVRDLDRFRAPPSAAEIARRRQSGLSPRQDAQLLAFGYPYVLADFRFHLTLTDRLEPPERDRLLTILRSRATAALARPVRIEDLCLFAQAEPDSDFVIAGRYPLAASGPSRRLVEVSGS